MLDREKLRAEFKEFLRENLSESKKINESEMNIAQIRKLYNEMDSNNDKWTNDLNKALKSYHNELEKLGYKKENDYTPEYDDTDEVWVKYDKIESELNKKYGIGDINKKYSTEQDNIGNKIWIELQKSIEIVPALKPYKDILGDEKHKFRIVNKFKEILSKLKFSK